MPVAVVAVASPSAMPMIAGDLHLSERIVTEIVPRRWNIGVEESGSGDNYHLLEFPNVSVPDTVSKSKSSG